MAGALSPQRTQQFYSTVVDAGVDLFVIRGTVVSAEHVSSGQEPLNLKKFIYDLDVPVIVGGASNYTAALHLMRTGAAGVLVGFGGGAVSATRQTIGVQAPMATAIADVAEARRDYMDESGGRYVQVIADGGIKFSGDIVKALVVGAHSVMIGSLFAGTEESPGETILYQGRTYKIYRGMGSIDAMKDGSSDRYFQEKSKKLVPEGIVGRVPYRGQVMEAVYQLMGGLRSGMGYVGAHNLKQLFENTTFCEISSAGLRESHVHDVVITKEAPNYRIEN